MHVPNCVICVLLYILSLILPFLDLFSCSSFIFLKSFLNVYSGIMFPSLPVSILYGISTVVSPTFVSKCAVISDRFLFKYTELILTVSISSSWGSCTISISTSCTTQSLLLLHTFLKWPVFPCPMHVFPYAGHCLGA